MYIFALLIVLKISTVTSSSLFLYSAGSLSDVQDDSGLGKIDEEYSTCNGIDIREITISDLQKLFISNKLSSVELTQCYIERISKMNDGLKAVIEINPDALLEARKADEERKKGKDFGLSMHGIPVLLKDNIATRGGSMETTAGSWAMVGLYPKKDADVVKALKKMGAVILGKANLSEMSYFRGTNIPSGWSSRGGQTRNSYNLNVTPLGSSSGSATAVAANLAVVSVGTETDGSLIAPASLAGVYALKTTHGRITSVSGVIPISRNQDTVGPMARNVVDLAILLDGMQSEDYLRSNQSSSPCATSNQYTSCLLHDHSHSRTFRVGILRHPFWNESAINSSNLQAQLPQLEEVISKMKMSYRFKVFDPVSAPSGYLQKVSVTNELTVLLHDFKHDLNLYLKNDVYPRPPISTQIKTLKDIIKFNEDNPNDEGYNQDLLLIAEGTDGINNKTYFNARSSNYHNSEHLLHSIFKENKLDAIITPSEARYESILDDTLEDSPIQGYSFAAIAGYPSLNVPVGIGLNGVPFGITLIGRPSSELRLLRVAYSMQRKIVGKRPRPEFIV